MQWRVAAKPVDDYLYGSHTEGQVERLDILSADGTYTGLCVRYLNADEPRNNARRTAIFAAAAPEMHAILTELAEDAEAASCPSARLPWYKRIVELLAQAKPPADRVAD